MNNTLDGLVYGHAQAKKALQVIIKRSQERYMKQCVYGEAVKKEPLKCLLVGQSGTGKTHLVQSMSKLYKFPLIMLDATQLTPSGNSDGVNMKQLRVIIDKKVTECLQLPEYHSREGVLNQLVIFVDEFDKLGVSFDSSGNWNKQVQANLLTVIENKEEFAGISWVFAGAFSRLYEPTKQSIGFNCTETVQNEQFSDQQLLNCGIIPELLGRISLIMQLDRFTKEDYRAVLLTRLLPNYDMALSNEQIDDIVNRAVNSGQGIRSMSRQLEMLSIELENTDTLTLRC